MLRSLLLLIFTVLLIILLPNLLLTDTSNVHSMDIEVLWLIVLYSIAGICYITYDYVNNLNRK